MGYPVQADLFLICYHCILLYVGSLSNKNQSSINQEFTRSWAQPATSWPCMSSKMAAYSLASDCIISHFSVADLPQTVPVAYWYAASLEQSFALPQICRRLFLWHTCMQQVWGKVSSCRRSACIASLHSISSTLN